MRARARIVLRLQPEEMKIVQAAADVVQVDVKELARMGVLKEAMDVRKRLIEQLQKEKDARDKTAGETDISAALQEGESSSIQGDSLDEQSQGGDDTGAES